MRNPNKPFFYRKKKNPLHPIFLIFVILAAVSFWISQVPFLRKIVFPIVQKGVSYGISFIKPIQTPDPRFYRIQTIVPTIELPSREVIFARNLDDLGSPNADLPELTTPEPTSEVFWILQEDQQQADAQNQNQAVNIQLVWPPFEKQDLFNDAVTAFSSVLRFFGMVENQYSVSSIIKPDPFDPTLSFDDMSVFLAESAPAYLGISRLNGTPELLQRILQDGFPVMIRLQVKEGLPSWKDDDMWNGRMTVVFGYDSASGTFTLSDPVLGNGIVLSSAEVLERWYPFAREYFVIYPADQEDLLKAALAEDWPAADNLERAAEKFQTDVTMIPDNPFAWLNYARTLSERGEYESALNAFRSADQFGIPQRYLFFDFSPFRTLFNNGAAYEIIDRSNFMIQMNSHCEECWLWNGWGNLLLDDPKKALQSFEKAGEISPNGTEVRYALEFMNQNR